MGYVVPPPPIQDVDRVNATELEDDDLLMLSIREGKGSRQGDPKWVVVSLGELKKYLRDEHQPPKPEEVGDFSDRFKKLAGVNTPATGFIGGVPVVAEYAAYCGVWDTKTGETTKMASLFGGTIKE